MSILAGVTALSVCLAPGAVSKADSVDVRPYIAFGADLTNSQKNTVMEQLGVTKDTLADYETIAVTNEDEHKYLDSYLDNNVIGTKALSSVKIEEADAGSGIRVETHNITFCTVEMYTNALATAGISDAVVTVAAPFNISGTAALVGAMKAYGTMTGEEIDSDSADAATNELVLTGELGDSIGKDEASQLIALVKDKVIRGDLSDAEEIEQAIQDAMQELNISLSDSQKQEILSLMQKIGDLDLDLGAIQDQAKGIYEKLKNLDIDLSQAEGILEKIGNFFAELFQKIAEFFAGLFK
ncbi:MAG: DUF1002 domain-containing protein [Lachnospiraceae bacterium]|nr:DUF1002 domain-containing protein [Lachnospiraceae bacterium]